jgi:excisionase family DNA binding protein
MNEPDLMTTQEVADWLRITRFSVYRYLKQGMPHYRIGPKHRFKRAEVEAWMKAQAEATVPTLMEHVPASRLTTHRPRVPEMSVAEVTKKLKELMG